MIKRLAQLELLREFSESAIRKVINKFLNDASESEIRQELKDFEKYKNGIQLKDPFQYKSWLEFTQAIHGAKGKSEFKKRNIEDKSKPKTFVNKSEELSDAIVDDENVTIFKGDSEHKCVKYGKGYSFCISRPGGGNMFSSYRLSKSSTFYFIYFKNVPKSNPKHIMVLDKTKDGWEWTFGDNNTRQIVGGFDVVVQKFPVLKKYEYIFENNPLSDKEKNNIKHLKNFKSHQDLKTFNDFDYELKNLIVKSGITLNDDIFKSLDKNLRNEYVSIGTNLTKYQAGNLNDSEIKRYRNVRKLTIDQYIDIDKYKPSILDKDLNDKVRIDENGIKTHYKDSRGNEWLYEYDVNGNVIYRKSGGFECWKEYDENGNVTHHKDSNGYEEWTEYDENGNVTHYKDSDGHESGVSKNIKKESTHIKRLTQLEIISEGFWDGFKPQNWGKVARGGLKVAGDVLRTVAPELTDPIDKLDNKLHGYKNSFKRGYGGIPDPERERSDVRGGITGEVAQSVATSIKLGLVARGVTLIPRLGIQPYGIDPDNGNKLYKLKAKTSRSPNGEWMLVDGRGNSS